MTSPKTKQKVTTRGGTIAPTSNKNTAKVGKPTTTGGSNTGGSKAKSVAQKTPTKSMSQAKMQAKRKPTGRKSYR